jgi:hypothetical protein
VKVGAVVGDGGPQGALTRLSCSLLGKKTRSVTLRLGGKRAEGAGLAWAAGMGLGPGEREEELGQKR